MLFVFIADCHRLSSQRSVLVIFLMISFLFVCPGLACQGMWYYDFRQAWEKLFFPCNVGQTSVQHDRIFYHLLHPPTPKNHNFSKSQIFTERSFCYNTFKTEHMPIFQYVKLIFIHGSNPLKFMEEVKNDICNIGRYI